MVTLRKVKKKTKLEQLKEAHSGKLTSNKFRSGFENKVSQLLPKIVQETYEKKAVKYVTTHSYTPDFELGNGWFLEVKGYFTPEDRGKHLQIKKQHGDAVKILFCFMNPNDKLGNGSKNTYAQWCDKRGFEWCSIGNLRQKILEIIRK